MVTFLSARMTRECVVAQCRKEILVARVKGLVAKIVGEGHHNTHWTDHAPSHVIR